MSLVFLSHAHESPTETGRVLEWLRELGYGEALFFDRDHLHAGKLWLPQLLSMLRACRVLVAVATPQWCASRFCFFEALHAHARGIPVLLLCFSKAPIDPALSGLQWVDIAPDQERPPPALVAALARLLPSHEAFALAPDREPYPGLRPFAEDEAALFFGRDAEIQDALRRIARLARHGPGDARLLLLVGPPGSGKSSLLRAGILARLARLPGFRVAAVGQPGLELAEAAERLAGEEPAAEVPVLAVDQLELALAAPGETPAARLPGALRRVMLRPAPVVVVAALRFDLSGELLAALDPEGVMRSPEILTVLPPGHAARETMMRGPLLRIGGPEPEDALVRRLQADLDMLPEGWSAALPMLAHALQRTWRAAAPDGRLGLAGYAGIGGLHGYAETLAARLRHRLTAPEDRNRLRALLIPSFVAADAEGRPLLRRRALRDLAAADRRLAEELVAAGLLAVAEDGTASVAHAVLLEAWPELRGWFDADGAALGAIARLRAVAAAWQRAQRSPRLLARLGETDRRVLETAALDPRFAPEFDEPSRLFLAALREGRQHASGGPLPASMRESMAALLQVLDRLRGTPGVRLEEVERMMVAIGHVAEDAVAEMEPDAAMQLLSEVDLRFAKIRQIFGDVSGQEERAAAALRRLLGSQAAPASRLRLAARLLLVDAAAAAGRFDDAFQRVGEAERELTPGRDAEAMRLGIRRAALLREAGRQPEARWVARDTLERLARSPLGETREGELLRARCLRELGASSADDDMLPDGAGQARTWAAQALDTLDRLAQRGAPGKSERLLRATLLYNRAAARPREERLLAEPDYRAAIAEVRAILQLDPGDHRARSDLAFYLKGLCWIFLNDDAARALEAAQGAFDEYLVLAGASPANTRWHHELLEAFKLVVLSAETAATPDAARPAVHALAELAAQAAEGRDPARWPRLRHAWLLAGLAAHELGWVEMARDVAVRLSEACARDDDQDAGAFQDRLMQFRSTTELSSAVVLRRPPEASSGL